MSAIQCIYILAYIVQRVSIVVGIYNKKDLRIANNCFRIVLNEKLFRYTLLHKNL